MKRFFGFDALRLNICQKAFFRENNAVTGRISPIYKIHYNLMEVLYIFPMIFKMKPIFDLIYLNAVSYTHLTLPTIYSV